MIPEHEQTNGAAAEDSPLFSAEEYRELREMTRIGNRAVQKAQAENRRRGIPNAYAHNGRLYYELPDGTITEDDPFAASEDEQ